MSVKRFSISFDEGLAERVQTSAGEANQPLSVWLAEAARQRVTQEALLEASADYQSEFGTFTPAEMEASRRRLGLSPKSQRKIA
jgi:hypothetical protein